MQNVFWIPAAKAMSPSKSAEAAGKILLASQIILRRLASRCIPQMGEDVCFLHDSDQIGRSAEILPCEWFGGVVEVVPVVVVVRELVE